MNHVTIFLSVAALVGSATASLAQTTSPYAGQEQRAIKALSDREISDLTEGRGMGLALAAELNGYPGPMHVLELADSLALSDQQRAKMQDLFVAMRAEAIPLGDKLIAHEAELDREFAHKTISPASLAASMAAIGTTQAELRQTHLKYHLSTVEVLTPAQVQRYRELRGYNVGMQHPHGRH